MLIELTYNPYLVETKIKIKGELLKHDDDLMGHCKNKRLQSWIDSLLIKIGERYRVREIELAVHCTDLDSEDVEDAVRRFNSSENDAFVNLMVNKHSQSIDTKIKQLKALYETSQDGPFEEFRDETLKKNFTSALSPDFEVNVIATMSSGKSTVINAILGQDLMPSKNEACTATIMRIQDSDSHEVFVGKSLDKDGECINESQKVTVDTLDQWNGDERTSVIELIGDIPTIQETESTRLVVVDTPGPNNSCDASHRKTMLDAINRKPLSMVLYILNATQISSDDDATLLKTVADEMKAGGREAQDRFIFVLNKIDNFDPEKGESVSSAIENVKQYLKKEGIDKPIVIPVSAELTKLIRIARYQGESELTSRQRNELTFFIDLFVEEDEMNMLNHVKEDISPLSHGNLSEKLKNTKNDHEKAEILSGIPIVEALFNEFLQKHALPAKIKDAVDSFRHVMAKAKQLENLNNQLNKGDDELKKAVKAIESFEDNEERITKAKEFRKTVEKQAYQPSKELQDSYKKIQGKVFELIQDKTEDFQYPVKPARAEREISKIKKDCENFIIDIETTIKKALDDDFIVGLRVIRNDYEKYVAKLLEKEFPSTEDIDLLEFQKESMKMPEVEDLIQNNTTEVQTDSYDVSDSSWYNPFSWGSTRTINTYEDMVDLSDIWDEISTQLRSTVQNNIENSNEFAEIKAEEGKQLIIKSMDNIDQVFKENLDNMKKASSNKEEAERLISENKRKLDWYDLFNKELNDILLIDEKIVNDIQAENKNRKTEPAMA